MPSRMAGHIFPEGFSPKKTIARTAIITGDKRLIAPNSKTLSPERALRKQCQAPRVKRLISRRTFQETGLIRTRDPRVSSSCNAVSVMNNAAVTKLISSRL